MKIYNLVLVILFLFVNQSALAGAKLYKIAKPYPAPLFDLPDMDGKRYKLADLKGKIVIVNFWTTWCPPCLYEMPAMERAWKKFDKKKVIIIAINIGETEDAIFSFTGKYPVTFPLVMDVKGITLKQWKVVALPTTFIVGPTGKVIYRVVGGREWDSDALIKKITSLHGAKTD